MGSKPSKSSTKLASPEKDELANLGLMQRERVADDPEEGEASGEDEGGNASSKATKITRNTDFADIRERIEACLEFLNSSEKFGENGIMANLATILRVYFVLKIKRQKDLEQICSILLEKGIIDIFVRMWDIFHIDKDEFYGNDKGLRFKILKKMKLVFMNYSNKCPELAIACYKDERVIQRLVKELTFQEFGTENLRSTQKRSMLKATFGVLINLLRHCNSNKDHIRKNNGLDVLLEYAKSSFLIIEAEAYIILAYCIDEDEQDKIATGEGVIKFIVKMLCSALSSANHVASAYGFSAEETLAALNKLASSDDNKKKIVEAGILPELTKVLSEEAKPREGEQYEAVNCLWTLAFHQENQGRIMKEHGLVNAVQRIKAQSQTERKERLNKACTSALFVLGLEDIHVPGEHNTPSSKHIMISYNWEVQDIVLKLRDFLKDSGYEVWIDVDKMQDSILVAMADAVENASIVLVAMTESYKNSNPCRTEAEYAYKRSVPVLPLLLQPGYVADGWLGAMLGTKLYVDLSAGFPDEKFDQVKQQITSIASTAKSTRKARDQAPVKTAAAQAVSRPSVPRSDQPYGMSVLQSEMLCSTWTKEDVQLWVDTLSLEDESRVPRLDGNSLSQLCKMLLRSPDNYYRIIREDLHFSVQDMLTFTGAIESLLLR